MFLVVQTANAQSGIFTGANQVSIGDLDVVGDQITVEALINHRGLFVNNIVSKHIGPGDVNYLLRPFAFEFSTVNGYRSLANTCYSSMVDSVWYHVAATYDGATAKYYVNGCLINSLNHTGALINQNLIATIGGIGIILPAERWSGLMDEVRIWNVARTQVEIASNMNSVSPLSAGLLGYYKFDNSLVNMQGNATFDGVASPVSPSFTYGISPVTIPVNTTGIGCSVALSADLIAFEATCMDDGVEIYFETINELNLDFFIIEKSIDGISWKQFAEIEAINEGLETEEYSFIDADLSNFRSNQYYRILTVDFDHSIKQISRIINVPPCFIDNDVLSFPNPVSDYLTISQSKKIVSFAITNSSGSICKEGFLQANRIDVSSLKPGHYSLQLIDEFGVTYYDRFVVCNKD